MEVKRIDCSKQTPEVGASSTVTKDIPDYAVAVGSPAKVIKYLYKEKFYD